MALTIRTTGSPTVIEDFTGDTRGGNPQNHNAFMGMAKLPNGNLLIAWDKSYTHGGGNCNIEYTILAPNGSTVVAPTNIWDSGGSPDYAIPSSNSVSADVSCVYNPNTREVMVLWNELIVSGSPNLRRYAKFYDVDAQTWSSSPVDVGMGFANATTYHGAPYAIAPTPPIVVGTDMYAAVYSYDTGYPGSPPRVACVKSTNAGRSWSIISNIHASDGTTWDETALIYLGGTTLMAMTRVDASPYTYVRAISTNMGSSWTNTHTFGSMNGAGGTTFSGICGRPSLIKDGYGTMWMCARGMISPAVNGNVNTYHVVRWSTDDGASWSDPIDPYTGLQPRAEPTNQTTRGYCVYGDFDILDDGNVAHVWAEEIFNYVTLVQPANAALFYRVLTTDPSTPLALDPSAYWAQSGTALTVNGSPGIRTSVSAVVSSSVGGVLRFTGTHADRFYCSLDGTAWTPTVTVPSGTTTVYLSVLPQVGDTTITASVGVPV